MKKQTTIILFLLLMLTACAARGAATPSPTASPVLLDAEGVGVLPPGAAIPAPPPTAEELRDARGAELVSGMTAEEKVGQLFFVRCAEPDMAAKIAKYHLGGVLLFTPDYKDKNGAWLSEAAFTAKLKSYQDAADLPLFIGSDEEGGTVTRASRNPNLFSAKRPSPRALYRAGGMTGLLAETRQYNARLRALGVNVNLAPVADVSTNPKDFIYDRAFGRPAADTADYVAQVVDAMGEAGVGCALKHFPGYGNNADTHTGVAIDRRARETFETSDLLPFRAGIEAGAPFVLVSHNVVQCMDAGLPASLSPAVHALLRDELGFTGVALTDDLAMDAVKAYAENGDAATLALLAGNDMILTTDFETQIAQVLAAVANGTVAPAALDAAVARVLAVKLQLGLIE